MLFGVLFAAELLFSLATQNLNPTALHFWHNLYLFLVLGIYFTYFWGHGGQTLPMQTWHIKVVALNGESVTFKQACIRYCAAWMWFLPALGLSYAFDIQHWASIGLICIGIPAWALTIQFDPNRQFLHDKLAATQVIEVEKVQRVPDTE